MEISPHSYNYFSNFYFLKRENNKVYKAGYPMKYFYYRLISNFFRQEVIRNMKHIPIYGYQFIVIYMELCSLATEEQGILKVPKIGEVPYIALLAKDIGEDTEIVGQAFTYFLNNGLIEKVEDDYSVNLLVPYVINNTGKGSTQADAKRLKYNNMKQQLLTSSKSNATYKKYGLYENIELTDLEYYELEGKTDNLKSIIDKISLEKSMGEEFDLNDYELILKHVKK